MSRGYATGTSVSVEKSKTEIERLLSRYGAEQFISGWESGRAMIGFRCQDRLVRFLLTFPSPEDKRFTEAKARSRWSVRGRTELQAAAAYDAELRRLWRALALVIKAKLEAVESGITSFENEFMAHIVMPDGKTIGDHVRPAAYDSGRVPKLLPAYTGDPS